jgi:hypothetical protein
MGPNVALAALAYGELPPAKAGGFRFHRGLPLQQRAFEDLRSLQRQDRASHPAASPETDPRSDPARQDQGRINEIRINAWFGLPFPDTGLAP